MVSRECLPWSARITQSLRPRAFPSNSSSTGRLPSVARMEKYAAGFAGVRMLHARALWSAGRRSSPKEGKYSLPDAELTALQAMTEGRFKDARRALLCAMRYRRPHLREILRLLRTYLSFAGSGPHEFQEKIANCAVVRCVHRSSALFACPGRSYRIHCGPGRYVYLPTETRGNVSPR
jgi:hypothetical protein